VAHVTPIELRDKLTGVDAANGFANRFLWLCVRRTQLIPFPKSPKPLIQPYIEPLHKAIAEAQQTGEMEWSVPAADRWESLYAERAAAARHGLLGAMVARSEAQIARLALLYALLDRSSEVRLEHLAAAEALWDYSERSVAYIFGASTGNRHADVLRDMLADGPVEWSDAKRSLGLRTAADLRDAVEILLVLRVAEVVPVGKAAGGRPKRVIRLVQSASPNEVQNVEQTVQTVQTTQPRGAGDAA
jgi:hypothetical protein